MVTPTYYVLFTFATLVTSIILFQGLDSSPIQIVTIVLGFLTICAGITLLQISKIDPKELTDKDGVGIDRNTTLLIRASRSHIAHEKGNASALEDPGVDTVRGGLGVIGSIVRARSSRRIHSSSDEYSRMADEHGGMTGLNTLGKGDLERYELHDRPMPLSPNSHHLTLPNLHYGMPQKRDTTISFASGSEEPHGHHSNVRGSGGSTSANAGNTTGGAGGILMSPSSSSAPQGNRIYHTEPASYLSGLQDGSRDDPLKSSESVSIRPIGPRIPRSDGAENLRTIWNDSTLRGDAASSTRSPDYNGDDDDGRRDYIDVGDETESSVSSSPNASKRSGKIFPIGRRVSQSKEEEGEAEAEELLSPIMRDQLEFAKEPSHKRRSRG
jgi:hypothetical protein